MKVEHEYPYIRHRSWTLKGSGFVSFEKDYELQQMSGKVTRMMIEVQYLCQKKKLESVAWFSLLNKCYILAFYKYVQVGYTSREVENYLKLILAPHQIVVNWLSISLN